MAPLTSSGVIGAVDRLHLERRPVSQPARGTIKALGPYGTQSNVTLRQAVSATQSSRHLQGYQRSPSSPSLAASANAAHKTMYARRGQCGGAKGQRQACQFLFLFFSSHTHSRTPFRFSAMQPHRRQVSAPAGARQKLPAGNLAALGSSSSSSGGKSPSRPAQGRQRSAAPTSSVQRRAQGSTVWRRDSTVGAADDKEPLPWQRRQPSRAKYPRPAGLGVVGASTF